MEQRTLSLPVEARPTCISLSRSQPCANIITPSEHKALFGKPFVRLDSVRVELNRLSETQIKSDARRADLLHQAISHVPGQFAHCAWIARKLETEPGLLTSPVNGHVFTEMQVTRHKMHFSETCQVAIPRVLQPVTPAS